ncbi:hypothetical protein [Gimesia panareensis]|uniref:hypothetical protein n=1 Tax=Gimesia panareensis TaxID=2527978 RepID=UPI001188B77E|nr:hypothetical protein [Gimesia panareensis]QDU52131.1 hypothetical protein Pan110_45030 [Gimesia panareensis]
MNIFDIGMDHDEVFSSVLVLQNNTQFESKIVPFCNKLFEINPDWQRRLDEGEDDNLRIIRERKKGDTVFEIKVGRNGLRVSGDGSEYSARYDQVKRIICAALELL